jgi:hypothetical protein
MAATVRRRAGPVSLDDEPSFDQTGHRGAPARPLQVEVFRLVRRVDLVDRQAAFAKTGLPVGATLPQAACFPPDEPGGPTLQVASG